MLSAEVENIEESIFTVGLDESDSFESDGLAELEMEMAAINGDFWKG